MALILVFASGFAALVYQVLWMKQLGLLFGNTSHAAAATLAAFFAGLAAGSWLWGRRSARMRDPLRSYAVLEVAIAATAGLYFVILAMYFAIYPVAYQTISSPAMLLGIKFLLAMLLVFPPALFMGGTIPVMGQYLIRMESDTSRRRFGTTGALLYAINTLGAALGALLAGFFLPLWLGYRLTCLAAIAVTLATAGVAYVMSRKQGVVSAEAQDEATEVGKREPKAIGDDAATATSARTLRERLPLALICFVSGFGFLSLEVLWTRMFMQVLENSVYTFASILVIVLICLAAGGLISSLLTRLRAAPIQVLAVLVLLGGVAIMLTPYLFMVTTERMQILASRGTWATYLGLIFTSGFQSFGLAALMLGMVFPFLMKTEERYVRSAGLSLGRLAAMNTIGAILGAMLCGFVFLGWLGMWATMQLIACLYLLLVLVLPLPWNHQGIAIRAGSVVSLVLLFTLLNPVGLPITSRDPLSRSVDVPLQVWEASDSTVAVTQGDRGLRIKINSHYSLGTTAEFRQETFQSDLPLMLYPKTRSIFFLGMGTGITAGAALDERFKNVKRVVVCELSPAVVTAAKQYFTDYEGRDYTNGLFEDPRVTILAEDGRHYLMATDQKFDMINADLFVPFRSGVGSLYTREHFENVKARLEPGGVFVQWLPLYQLTEYEFSVIARTMLSVFDQVTMWRGNFQPFDDTVMLVGRSDRTPLKPIETDSRLEMRQAVAGKGINDLARLALPFNEETALLFYAGNLRENAALFEDYPINTDDRPVVEYMAPRSYRARHAEAVPWFVGPNAAKLIQQLQANCPPQTDPLLVNRSLADRQLPLAGTYFYDARFWQMLGEPQRCFDAWQRFLGAWLAEPGDS